MDSLTELKAKNERAAARELAELRADTVKGLRFAFEREGITGVTALLIEADVLRHLFDSFADARANREAQDVLLNLIFPNGPPDDA